MENTAGRWEFRVWSETLDEPKARLQRLASPAKVQTSSETYLVSAATDNCNAKIRGGLLDVKSLIAMDRGLERWTPSLKVNFPIESSILAAQFFPLLELKAPRLTDASYSLDEFFNEIVDTVPDLTVLPIFKTRRHFALDECQSEVASVIINKIAFETIAVEALNPDAILRLIRELGIEAKANTSYVRQIKHLLRN